MLSAKNCSFLNVLWGLAAEKPEDIYSLIQKANFYPPKKTRKLPISKSSLYLNSVFL